MEYAIRDLDKSDSENIINMLECIQSNLGGLEYKLGNIEEKVDLNYKAINILIKSHDKILNAFLEALTIITKQESTNKKEIERLWKRLKSLDPS
jgi:hypothetical protein